MGHEEKTFEIRFEGLSQPVAGTKAVRLRKHLLDVAPDANVTIAKDDPSNQDFGATLVVVLGTPAVLAVAKGIASYLMRDRGKISIFADGKVIAENISGKDAARIAEAMSKTKK